MRSNGSTSGTPAKNTRPLFNALVSNISTASKFSTAFVCFSLDRTISSAVDSPNHSSSAPSGEHGGIGHKNGPGRENPAPPNPSTPRTLFGSPTPIAPNPNPTHPPIAPKILSPAFAEYFPLPSHNGSGINFTGDREPCPSVPPPQRKSRL